MCNDAHEQVFWVFGPITADRTLTYADLKKELPFPCKMVAVPLTVGELKAAVHYSRCAREEGGDPAAEGTCRSTPATLIRGAI